MTVLKFIAVAAVLVIGLGAFGILALAILAALMERRHDESGEP